LALERSYPASASDASFSATGLDSFVPFFVVRSAIVHEGRVTDQVDHHAAPALRGDVLLEERGLDRVVDGLGVRAKRMESFEVLGARAS
jgi:hypothetical protein